MRGHHTEILHTRIGQQRLAEQPRCVFDKDRIGGVELGKGLLVLALYHHLRLSRHGSAAKLHQILEPEAWRALIELQGNPRNGTLRMRCGQLTTCGACMLGEFQRTRAGRRIDVIEMHDLLAHTARLHELECQIVVLIALQPGPQRVHLHREGRAHLDAGVKALKIAFIGIERLLDDVERKGLLGVFIEGAHDARHVDALLFGLKAHRARHRGLKRQVAVVARPVTDRKAEV